MVQLIPDRQDDLGPDRPDYFIHAGKVLVGRIYKTQQANWAWFWGLNGVITDNRSGIVMHGQAPTLDVARRLLRETFDKWVLWAQSILPEDLKYPVARDQLRRIGMPL